MVFYWRRLGIVMFLVGFVAGMIMMGTYFGNALFHLWLRFVKILNFTNLWRWISLFGLGACFGMGGCLYSLLESALGSYSTAPLLDWRLPVVFDLSLQSSDGSIGPVRMMKDTCAVSAMVTFLSWMADVRTSFFIVRIFVGNRNGSTSRSSGSNNMFPPVLCLGQEWHVVCQRVRKVYPLLLWRTLGTAFFFFCVLFCALCVWEVLVSLVALLGTRLGLHWSASCWTRLSGGGRWEHYLCNHWMECQAAHEIAYSYLWFYDYFIKEKPYMLALVGRPSLRGNFACMVYWTGGRHFGEFAGKNLVRPVFLLLEFFCLVAILGKGSGVLYSGIYGLGGLVILGPPPLLPI